MDLVVRGFLLTKLCGCFNGCSVSIDCLVLVFQWTLDLHFLTWYMFISNKYTLNLLMPKTLSGLHVSISESYVES